MQKLALGGKGCVKTTGDVRLLASELKGGCRAERLQSLLQKLFVQGEMMKNVSTECCSAGWGCGVVTDLCHNVDVLDWAGPLKLQLFLPVLSILFSSLLTNSTQSTLQCQRQQ